MLVSDLNRLHGNWQRVIEFRNREVQEDDADTQEVLEDFLTRGLTREYLDLLKVFIYFIYRNCVNCSSTFIGCFGRRQSDP